MTWELHNAKNNTWNAIDFRFYRFCCESVGVVVVVVNEMLFCISSHHIKSNWKSHNFNVHTIPFYLVFIPLRIYTNCIRSKRWCISSNSFYLSFFFSLDCDCIFSRKRDENTYRAWEQKKIEEEFICVKYDWYDVASSMPILIEFCWIYCISQSHSS